VLAARYGVTLDTIYRWRGRTGFEDRSHTALQLATTLPPPQEAVAVASRRMLLLPLDDRLAVTREFLNPGVSRSGLDRCLRRHGVRDSQVRDDLLQDEQSPVRAELPLERRRHRSEHRWRRRRHVSTCLYSPLSIQSGQHCQQDNGMFMVSLCKLRCSDI